MELVTPQPPFAGFKDDELHGGCRHTVPALWVGAGWFDRTLFAHVVKASLFAGFEDRGSARLLLRKDAARSPMAIPSAHHFFREPRMAAVSAVIIVPSQGEHASMFKGVAKAADRKIYGGRAVVVTTSVTLATDTAAATVNFQTASGKSFSWADQHDLKSVVTISHGFSGDGPNLAYGLGDERYQAWGIDDGTGELEAAAKEFWGIKVGKALKKGGKIVLVGCFMGKGEYARNVARAAGVSCFAATGLFAAANEETTLKHLKAIEGGRAMKPMVEAKP
ncbi:hypothetical protein [Aquincola sp. J276]|uniref:hypothetical protein n=1 Tax=Aquincola sp. J276 TaxID=2898432 RepID=UPI002150EDC8|nr:hypothetical protein [Aquincola sp. J276]MCR5864039.1 hypothetical protein [Aquincola sp. J276]